MEPNTISQTPAPAPIPTPVPASAPVRARLEGPISLLKSAFGLFRSHWKILTLIVGLPSIVGILSQFVVMIGNPAFMIIGIVCTIIGVILSFALPGASIDAIKKLSANSSEKITVVGQYKYGFSVFLSLLLVLILQYLVMFGASFLLIIPGVIVGGYLWLSMYVCIIDGKGGWDALVESYNLIKGYWWAVLGRMFAFIVGMWILMTVMLGIMILLDILFSSAPIISAIIFTILNVIVNVFLYTVMMIYVYRLYESLKLNRTQNNDLIKARKWFKIFAMISPLAIFIIIFIMAFVLSKLDTARIQLSNAQNQLQNQNIQLDINATVK